MNYWDMITRLIQVSDQKQMVGLSPIMDHILKQAEFV